MHRGSGFHLKTGRVKKGKAGSDGRWKANPRSSLLGADMYLLVNAANTKLYMVAATINLVGCWLLASLVAAQCEVFSHLERDSNLGETGVSMNRCGELASIGHHAWKCGKHLGSRR